MGNSPSKTSDYHDWAFHTPFTPSISHFVHPDIVQLFAVDYKNSKQFPAGAGNKGVQIAGPY